MSRFLHGPGRTGFIAPIYVGGMDQTPPNRGTQPRIEGVPAIDRVRPRTVGPYEGTPERQIIVGVQPYDNRRMNQTRSMIPTAEILTPIRERLERGIQGDAYTQEDGDYLQELWRDMIPSLAAEGRRIEIAGWNKENHPEVAEKAMEMTKKFLKERGLTLEQMQNPAKMNMQKKAYRDLLWKILEE